MQKKVNTVDNKDKKTKLRFYDIWHYIAYWKYCIFYFIALYFNHPSKKIMFM